MSQVDEEREQEILAELARVEAEEEEAHRAAIQSNADLQAARETYDASVRAAQTTLDETVAENRRVHYALGEHRAKLSALKTELARARGQFAG